MLSCRTEARQPAVLIGYLKVVTPVVELPPPLEVRVIKLGDGMLVKNTWNTPGRPECLVP